MNLHTLKSELRDLIAQGNKLPSVFERLDTVLSDSSDFRRFVTIRKSNLSKLKQDFMAGIISDDDYKVENNKIRNALQLILEDVTEDDLQKVSVDQIELAISELEFSEPLGSIHLVNCNREANFEAFEEFFYEKKKLPHQFYFIVGCPTQYPADFAERIVYEILSEELDGNDDAMNYCREERPLHKLTTTTERVKIESLPKSKFNVELSKQKFRKYFAARVPQYDNSLSLEEFIAQKAAQLDYAYFSFLFSIEADEWNESLTEYLDWLLLTFEQNKKTRPIFQFFFIINMEKAYETANSSVMQEIEKVLAKHREDSTLILDLAPILPDELKKWLRKAMKNRQIPDIEKIVALYIEKLKSENRFKKDKLDMMDAEDLQTAVYTAWLKRSKSKSI